MQPSRGGFSFNSSPPANSAHNFFGSGEHRDHDGSYADGRGGSHGYRGGRGRGSYRSRGRGGRGGFGSPDRGGGSGGKFFKRSYSEEVREQVDMLYNKKITLCDEYDQWHLPDPSIWFRGAGEEPFQVDSLLELKRKLNDTKNKLDGKEMTSWHRHTNFTNRAVIIIPMLRRDFNPELCTQSWAKLHEILWTFKDVVPETAMKFNSIHLCEAPGAFVASLNHFIKTHRTSCQWNWKAITLNPYYEGNDTVNMVDQDKFMSETMPHWSVGVDNTGDITNWNNMIAFRDSVKNTMSDIDLVTADGNIDCFNNPGEQEVTMSQLLFCEVVTAFVLLKTGGCFILKTYTTLEHHTLCLMYLLVCCFKEVQVVKPATSKAGNSEQYLVCFGYKGNKVISQKHLEKMKQAYGPTVPMRSFFPEKAIPQSFLTQLTNCATNFAKWQMDVIEENVRLYDCMKFSEKQFIVEVKELMCDTFKTRFKLKSLQREKAVVQHLHLSGSHLNVMMPVQGDPMREKLMRRSAETFLASLEQRKKEESTSQMFGGGDDDENDGISPVKHPRITLSEDVCRAVQHLLVAIGYEGAKNNDKPGDQALVAMEIEPDDVQWLKCAMTSRSHDVSNQLNSLEGLIATKVSNSRFCRHEVLKNLSQSLDKSQIMQSSRADEHTHIASHVTPCHALTTGHPPFYFSNDALNFAALDYLTGFTKMQESKVLMFMDLSGAPSGYSHYVYWKKQHLVKGWGMVRVECPHLGPGKFMEQLAPWETFQVLGPHDGVDIRDNNIIKSLCAGIENYCPDGVHLVIGSVPSIPFGAHPPGYAEFHSKRYLLAQLICTCKILSQGGTFICRTYELFTRFSAGLLFIMYKLFEEVAIIKPLTSSPTSSERFLVCRGFQQTDHKQLIEKLLDANVLVNTVRKNSSNVDVLEVLPMQHLFDEPFYRYLSLSNEKIAKHRTSMIAVLENYFVKPETLPVQEEQELLRKGILEILELPENPY